MANESIASANKSLQQGLGIAYAPLPGYVKIGVDQQGRDLYASQAKATDNDVTKGAAYVDAYKEVLNPFGIFNDEDSSWLEQVKDVSQDVNLIGQLTQAAESRDAKQFGDILLQRYGKQVVNQLTDNDKDKAALNASLNAYSLYSNWNNLSEAQKATGIANVGIQAYEGLTGDSVAKKVIPGSESAFDGKGITVGQALSITQLGFNGYALGKNWSQLSAVEKLAYGSGSLAQAAALGESLGLIGKNVENAVIPGVSAESLAAVGASPAPAYGVGAVVVDPAGTVPAGYSQVGTTRTGELIAVPQGLEKTAAVPANGGSGGGGGGFADGSTTAPNQYTQAIGQAAAVISAGNSAYQLSQNYGDMSDEERAIAVTQTAGGIGTAANAFGAGIPGAATITGIGGVAGGAYQTYKAFGTGGAKGRQQGALGGASMASGLIALGATNPYLLAGVVALSITAGSVKKGKHTHQVERDMARTRLKENGLIGNDYTLQLPDGTSVDVGVDGNIMPRGRKDPSKKAKTDTKEELAPFDIDYTSDMDYFSGLAGVGLTAALMGDMSRGTKQVGGQIGNAALGKLGFGADLTPDNFDQVMQNHRALYAKAGINSKTDAYQTANTLYAEGKINDSELVALYSSYDLVFDNDFMKANSLAAGRFKGVELAGEMRDPDDFTETQGTTKGAGLAAFTPADRAAAIERNKNTYGQYQEVA